MEKRKNGILIKYRNFTDKDLRYTIDLIHNYFNGELMERLNWEERYPQYRGRKKIPYYLHAPLEIVEISSEKSIEINLIINIEIIGNYLELNFPNIVEEASSLIERHGKEILEGSILLVIGHFHRRRRKDKIDEIEVVERDYDSDNPYHR